MAIDKIIVAGYDPKQEKIFKNLMGDILKDASFKGTARFFQSIRSIDDMTA